MPKEIGYIHLAATTLASGLISKQVDRCDNYDKEFKHVNLLLTARYDIETLADRSRAVFASLIKSAFQDWWAKSRYNVQIDIVMRDIMKFTIDQLEHYKHKIIKRGVSVLVVDDVTDDEFNNIQGLIEITWPGLISYSENVINPETINAGKY